MTFWRVSCRGGAGRGGGGGEWKGFFSRYSSSLPFHIEGFQPEWYILTLYYCRDIPFWLETFNIISWFLITESDVVLILSKWIAELTVWTLWPNVLWKVFMLVCFCLVGLVVKMSASGAEDPGFESCLRWDFSRSSHTSDLKLGTPVATLPGAWHYRVSTRIGLPSVSILWLGEKVWSAACISMRQHVKLSVQICPWDIDTLACCWDVRQPTNKQNKLHEAQDMTDNHLCRFRQ